VAFFPPITGGCPCPVVKEVRRCFKPPVPGLRHDAVIVTAIGAIGRSVSEMAFGVYPSRSPLWARASPEREAQAPTMTHRSWIASSRGHGLRVVKYDGRGQVRSPDARDG
jgi:hypothetical protein